jgi:hypothetical protein
MLGKRMHAAVTTSCITTECMPLAAQVAASGWLFMDTCNYLTVTGPDVVTYQQDQYPITQGTILSSTQQSDGTFQSKVQASAAFLQSLYQSVMPLCESAARLVVCKNRSHCSSN